MADETPRPRRRVSARAGKKPRPGARASAKRAGETGGQTGNQTGNQAGDQAGDQAGNQAGNQAGDQAAKQTGSETTATGSASALSRRRPKSARPTGATRERGEGTGTVIITGICGRMGKLLARKLHRERPVVGIDRREFVGKPADIVHHQLDLRRRKTRDIFRAGGIDAVVHLGVMHNLRETDRAHHEWNVVGFQKLLEYVSDYEVPKLVVMSSATLYGPSPDNPQFLSEDAPLLGAQEFIQIRDLVEVDMLAQSFFWKNPELETVILRPCHILGRVRNAPSNYCRMDRPMTVMGFDPMMQVIHERDVVEAINLALRPGLRGIFNLRGPGELPLSRMLRILGKNGRPLPGPLMKGVMSRMWSYRASGFPTPELDHLRYICMVDDTRARHELGFEPQYDIEQTLRAVYSER